MKPLSPTAIEPDLSILRPKSFVDLLWQHLDEALRERSEKRFARFLKQRGVTKWIIATDFCIAEPTRPLDAFAFVVFPAGTELDETTRRLEEIPARDLKTIRKKPSKKMLRLLRKGKIFSFCFVVERSSRLYADAATLRRSLDDTLAMMESWENAEECTHTISHFRRMRAEADKSSVSTRLLANIVLCAALAAQIGALICKHSSPERIGWAPDRDKITEAYEGAAPLMFNLNLSTLADRLNFKLPPLGIFVQSNRDLWFDAYVRVADYVAGAAAAWQPPMFDLVHPKILEVLKAFADNPYLFVFKIKYDVKEGKARTEVANLQYTRRKPS